MRRKFRPFRMLIIPCVFFILLPLTTRAGGPGSTSEAFLKLPSGARAIGMGESYTAAGDDVQSIGWNPAGIARMQRREFTFMHAEWFQGITYNSIAYAMPLGGFIFVGGGVDFLDSGKIDKTTFNDFGTGLGSVIGPESVGFTSGTDTFSVSNVVVTGTGAVDLSGLRWIPIPNVQGGMNVRVLMQKIDKQSAAGAIVDLGALWTPVTVPNLTAAAVAQNLGPSVGGKIPPFTFRLGAAYKWLNGNLLTASDLLIPVDNYPKLSLGAEYWYKNLISFRSGYVLTGNSATKKFGADPNLYGTGGLEGLSMGAGFRYQIVQLDYAFATLGFLGATHRVSLTVHF